MVRVSMLEEQKQRIKVNSPAAETYRRSLNYLVPSAITSSAPNALTVPSAS
jgi:hypothetical protein